jgi:hypothetical protein
VSGDLTLNSMAQIHTSVTLLMSRDLTWHKQSGTHFVSREVTRDLTAHEMCATTEI